MTITHWLERRWIGHGRIFMPGSSPAYVQFLPIYPAERHRKIKDFLAEVAPRGYDLCYKCWERNAVIMAREPYRTVLCLARWWDYHRWCLEEIGIRLGLLRSPTEGDWLENYRFDPPDLWGTPIRRHERHLQ